MSTVAAIEDKLIQTVTGLGLFRSVASAGRKALPAALSHPSAYVFFVSETDTGVRSRPVVDLEFEVAVVVRNSSSEEKAAKNAYELIDGVRDAINGKTLGITDIEPFACVSRSLAEYESGVITYTLRFRTRQYLPVVVE